MLTNFLLFFVAVVSGDTLDAILNSEGLFDDFSSLSEAGGLSALQDSEAVAKAYSKFSKQFQKNEDPKRAKTFQGNLQAIAKHNIKAKKFGGYQKGVNQFTDVSFDEIIKHSTGYKPSDSSFGSISSTKSPKKPPLAQGWSSPPDSLDWREYDVVSPVKNQGGCGACVLFSATGCHESAHALWHNGEILDLSEQELVDCATGNGNNGCNGDTFVPTFKYMVEKGQCSEQQYPFGGSDGWDDDDQCGKCTTISKLTGYWPVSPADDEGKLMEAVAFYGPVSIALCVNDDFVQYKSGIFTGPSCSGRNHAVLVVGYGTDADSGQDFWIIKNSWSTSWGENGFMRLGRNMNNLCGLAGDAVFANA